MLYFQPILVFSNSSIRFLCCDVVTDVVVAAAVVVVVCYGRKIPIFEPTRIMIESSTHSAVFSSLQFSSVLWAWKGRRLTTDGQVCCRQATMLTYSFTLVGVCGNACACVSECVRMQERERERERWLCKWRIVETYVQGSFVFVCVKHFVWTEERECVYVCACACMCVRTCASERGSEEAMQSSVFHPSTTTTPTSTTLKSVVEVLLPLLRAQNSTGLSSFLSL